MPKKDYAYRGTWEHKFSRARNKAHRGGLSKKKMLENMEDFQRKTSGGDQKQILKNGNRNGLLKIQNFNHLPLPL